MRNQNISLLFSLLRESLWRNVVITLNELSAEHAKNLFALAEKQAVLGLLIDALIRNNVRMPQREVFKAVGGLEQIKRVNYRVNDGVVKLHQIMEKYSVNYAVIKGQVVASYYPDALIRQSGDIDYYSNPGYYDRSMQAVK